MASTAELDLLVKARDEASGVLGAVSKKAGGLANVMGKAVRVGAIAGGVAVAGLGIAAVKMGLDFEKSMAEVKTLLPTLSEEGFGELKRGVLDLSKELGIATSDAVPALYQAISAGVPPDNVMDFMRTASKAAIGGVTDLETAVDGISSVVNAYGDAALSAGATSDVMFTAVRLGKTNFEELSASLFNVIPTAASLGIGFEEIAAAMAVMTAQGVPTSVATTQLRQAFVEASKGGSLLDKAIREMAGAGLADLVKEGATATGIFEDLRSSMPEQDFRDLFGSVEAMNAVLQLTGPNAQAMADALGETMSSAGASEAAFETMAKTASFKLNKAINLLKVTLTELGLKALPIITKVLDFLIEKVPLAVRLFTGGFTQMDITSSGLHGQIEQLGLTVRQVFNALKSAIKILAPLFVKGLGVMKDAFEPLVRFIISNKAAMIAAIAAIGVAILLAFGPGAIAVVAIIAFIALLGVIKDNWDKLKIVIIPVGIALGIVAGVIFALMIPALIGMAAAAIAAVIPFLLLALPIIAIVAVIALVVAAILLLIKHFDEVKAALGAAAEFIGEKATEVKDFLVGAFNTVLDFLKENWPLILAILTGPLGLIVLAVITFKDDIIRIFGEVVTWIKGLPSKILSALGSLTGLLTQKGKDLLIGLAAGYLAQWSAVFRWLSDLPVRIGNAVGSLASRLWFSGWELISGLWNGIKARATRIFGDLKQLANDILGAITDPLGIFSPSKAMREVGVNLMEGLRLGLEDQSIKVNATAGNIAGGILGAAAGGSPADAAGGGGRRIEVHFHFSTIGMSRADLAAFVRQALPEIERQLDIQG